ncbi:dipeptide ABC transporter ATP-binding protein [Luteimicrobium subarcticum]|uniref:Peptide/nickel transport system ATP-binding protein n=1 Tax=Luteimicrobium subarcticum TaxID=620910 RepID=A0A2M8WRW6_9MICO|nr:ABC transporter ATP-binding protein [Luteimicrobium subarcticum]PJI93681.1 peptide/nickel transport system ATP-binding protein [Luteimicrobium subarcticum]
MSETEDLSADVPATPELLRVDGLTVGYGREPVVHDVGLTVSRGETVALIGESGSGKSTVARAVLRLLPRGAWAQGSVTLAGHDALGLSEAQFRRLRGRVVGFVPQDPASSLNPVRTIGAQADEAARLLDLPDRAARRARVLEVLARVGLDDPERVHASYPHQLSGGMLQRVLIALAVLPGPDLLVADEPTSALDVTVQQRILDLLAELQDSLGLGILLITHDLALAAERADRLAVLRDGRVQESGPSRQVLLEPASEYARTLGADVPSLHPDRFDALRARRSLAPGAAPQIELRGVDRTFRTGDTDVVAASGVSFAVARGTTHALVGESGSGKTTAVRILLGLETPDAGEVLVGGEALGRRSRAQVRALRRHLQLVYQNPFTSLDPTWSVERLVREPLDRFRVGTKAERAEAVARALDDVGLSRDLLGRRPVALSGGQRQRVAIARALVLRPDVIVLDEPTTALDVTVQAGIVRVLLELQARHGLTYLFVSHDLGLVRQVADTVSVLERGRVVEHGHVADVFTDPQHPYTRALLAAVPRAAQHPTTAQHPVPAQHPTLEPVP